MLLTIFAAYCLYHRAETEDLRLSKLRDLKNGKGQKSFGYIRKVWATAKLLLQKNYGKEILAEIEDCKMFPRTWIEIYRELHLIC